MIGAIIGDVIGSVYEWENVKTTDFPLFSKRTRFTDDTVLTVATADSILNQIPYWKKYKEYFSFYPDAGYGGNFHEWASSKSRLPYNSWGNGSAMRVSPVGYAFDTLDEVMKEAKKSAEVTHNHPEGIKGAQAVASSIFLLRTGFDKNKIKEFISDTFQYSLDEPLESIRSYYKFDVSCQGSVPQSITAFLESNDFEDAIRKAISIGGDSDTIACIAGSISQAYYRDIPTFIEKEVWDRLDVRLQGIVKAFREKYNC